MSHIFRGTGVALVTPFTGSNTIDYPALEKLIDHVIAGGVNYLVALGTTGEAPTLSTEEKRDVLAYIISKCNGRVPVVCGIGGNNTAEIIHQLDTWHLEGVQGILSVAPYYNRPSQEGLYRHFKAIAEAATLPIILYNVPGRTASNISAAVAIKLASEFKNIVAIKEASGNMAQCMELVMNKPDHFAILSGDDNLALPQLAIGMEGIISVAANCYAKDFTQMVQLALDNQYDAARRLHYKLLPGLDLLFTEGNPAGVKCVLKTMGICENNIRLPLTSVSDDTCKKIEVYLQNF